MLLFKNVRELRVIPEGGEWGKKYMAGGVRDKNKTLLCSIISSPEDSIAEGSAKFYILPPPLRN